MADALIAKLKNEYAMYCRQRDGSLVLKAQELWGIVQIKPMTNWVIKKKQGPTANTFLSTAPPPVITTTLRYEHDWTSEYTAVVKACRGNDGLHTPYYSEIMTEFMAKLRSTINDKGLSVGHYKNPDSCKQDAVIIVFSYKVEHHSLQPGEGATDY